MDELHDLGYSSEWPPGDVVAALAKKYDVDMMELESSYIDEIETARENDEAWGRTVHY